MLKKLTGADVRVPLDVPKSMRDVYTQNWLTATSGVGRLMLFAGDQKVEHLNDDFYGAENHADDAEPEHLFRIASQSKIGVFATQLGLLARYGEDYRTGADGRDVPYLVKLNSKSHLVKAEQRDPLSKAWFEVKDVAELKEESGLNIVGVGYTVYVGSEFETDMLVEAARMVHEAHRFGMVTVLWMYPRGKAVKDEKNGHLIAGAAGVAACLGSDFAKVNYPAASGNGGSGSAAEALKEAVLAAGRTGVVCAGGTSTDNARFLQDLHDQIHIGGAVGNATGRNIHQKSLAEAVKMTNAIYALTVEDKSVEEAMGMVA